jgi:polyhydroxybutyrate depolymerase
MHTVSVHGTPREYLLHLPVGLRSDEPAAVVLNFHGGGSNAWQQRSLTQMNDVSDAGDFLVVYPQGTPGPAPDIRTWNAGSCCGKAQRDDVDDIGFVLEILRDLTRRHPLDETHVHATGMSNGAMLTYRLACALSDTIASIAPVAGTIGIERCAPRRPIPLLHFHGTADEFAPYAGGVGRIVASGSFASVASTVSTFVRINGCRPEPSRSVTDGDAIWTTYASTQDGPMVTLCAIDGGGHTWPGGKPVPGAGKTTLDVSASEEMWRFFRDHPLPAESPARFPWHREVTVRRSRSTPQD